MNLRSNVLRMSVLIGLSVVLCFGVGITSAAGKPVRSKPAKRPSKPMKRPAKPTKRPKPKKPGSVKTSASLKKLYQAIGSESYLDAYKLATSLTKNGRTSAERFAAFMAYGRVLLALEKKASISSYLAKLNKYKLTKENSVQLRRVYVAWHDAQNGKRDRAIQALQKILKRGLPLVSTAEAADVLAILHLQKKDRKQAQVAVQFGLGFIARNKLKTNYVGALLKRRMKKNSAETGEAIALYKKAKILQKEEKFRDAINAYASLRRRFPKSGYYAESGYRIGEALFALKDTARAKAQWAKTVKSDPTGGWRGQAHLGLMKVAIQVDRNPTAARKQIETARSLLKNIPKESRGSWDLAAADLHLEAGILAFAAGDSGAATTAFNAAKKSRMTVTLLKDITSLLETAKSQEPLLPKKVLSDAKKDRKNQLSELLAITVIYNELGRFEQADELATAIGRTKNLLRTNALKSFNALQHGRSAHGLDEFDTAKKWYRSALSIEKNGSWHDETYYCLGILTEMLGEPTPYHNTKKQAKKKEAITPQAQQEKRNTARKNASYYWKQLHENFPNSRYQEAAIYHRSDRAYELLLASTTDPQKLVASWEKLVKQLTDFIQKYPKSRWVADCRIKLIDAYLEQLFKLPEATQQAAEARTWLANTRNLKPNSKTEQLSANPQDPLALPNNEASTKWRDIKYTIYIRSGLIAYIQQNPSLAATYFQKAKPHQPPRTFVVVHGTIPTGIDQLIKAAQQNKELTPKSARKGDETTRLIIMLADIYHLAKNYKKSLYLCNRSLALATKKTTKTQKSYAYFKRGRNYYQIPMDNEKTRKLYINHAYKDYLTSQKIEPKSEWADNALFFAANIAWNHGDKSTSAAKKKTLGQAIGLWKKITQQYPKGDEAERAALHIGVAYRWNNRLQDAKNHYQSALKKFPDSRFNEFIHKELKEIEQQLKKPTKKKPR